MIERRSVSGGPRLGWVLILLAGLPVAAGAQEGSGSATPPAAATGSTDRTGSDRAGTGEGSGQAQTTAPLGLPELIAGERGWFGVMLETIELPEAQTLGFDHELIRVSQVFPGSPAAVANVQPGDLVLRFQGESLTTSEDLVQRVSGTAPGTQVTFVLWRDGHEVEQPILLGLRPELDDMVVSMFRDQPAPPLAANRVADNTPLALPSGDGQVVVLDFWATWCGPCLHAMPMLEDLQRRFADRGVTFIGLSSESPDVLREFAASNPVAYTLAYDIDQQTTRAYWITAYPTLFVIDSHGTIRDVFIGGDKIPELEARLTEMVGSP